TGIVKRPYPTATDRRFALVPRQASDIVLGKGSVGPGASASATGASTGSPATTPGQGASGVTGASAAGTSTSATDIDLRDLAAHVGERVRVGGLVTSVQVDGVRLDDGTSVALLVFDGDAPDLLGLLGVGDALNATGVPEQRDGPVLVVAGAADVELVGELGAADPSSSGATQAAAAAPGDWPEPTLAPVRAVLAPGPGLDALSTGLGTLVLVSLASVVAMTLARRERSRRVLRSRIVARLEAFGRGGEGSGSAPDRPAEPPSGAQTGPELGGNVRGSA
ncbi:MAG TPA: OB-fold nucleic acid binding domain-containing protein, partial [Candidatus Limnocylindrales bacterium]